MNSLNLNAEKVVFFRISINGKDFDFEVASEWNGLVELKHNDGTIIANLIAPDEIQEVFDEINGRKLKDYALEVVRISPNLFDKINEYVK